MARTSYPLGTQAPGPVTRVAFLVVMALAFCGTVTVSVRSQETSPAPAHLNQAHQLVENLRGAELNVYGGGKRHIDWETGHASARTVCSSFTTLLLQHTYGWTNAEIKDWLSSTNPEAFTYHDAIVSRNRFLRIVHVASIKPGDILAVKYTDHHVSSNGVEDTGHVMLVAEAPREIETRKPNVEGTHQYLITVIDSSASGHGAADTRHRPGGKFTGGIGRGSFRIYSDNEGKIAGYAWSDSAKSTFFSAPERELVVGRLKLTGKEKPAPTGSDPATDDKDPVPTVASPH